jgi:hypothetical protein
MPELLVVVVAVVVVIGMEMVENTIAIPGELVITSHLDLPFFVPRLGPGGFAPT